MMTFLLASAFLCGQQARDKDDDESAEGVPQGPAEEVVVTASRVPQPVLDATASATIVSKEDLANSPSPLLDATLRQSPVFTTFRRSTSLDSHPTTQGVSLRGIGPSGTSRSLVLLDGVPLNDPFGGWVYWNRIPATAMQRVEMVRGATSQLYGSSALAGTIQLLTRPPERREVGIRGTIGSFETYDLDASYTDRKGPWGLIAAGRVFDTAGYIVVRDADKGEVDVPAYVDFESFFGRASFKDFHAGVNVYHENRGNGTPLQTNRSNICQFETGVTRPTWDLNFYAQSGVLESRFSRILPDRSGEVLTSEQRYASSGIGASATARVNRTVLVGTDWRLVKWDDYTQNLWGGFVQGLVPLDGRLDFQAGLRFDLWENLAVQTSVSPRAGILFRASEQFTLRGSAYRGFRAPTLNELYRPFQVGNTITEANPALDAESLWGGEAGVDYHPSSRLLIRFNAYANRLEAPVSNVTVSVSDGVIYRRRENLGSAMVRGLEAEGEVRIAEGLSISAAYLLSSSRVSETGLRFPQAPLHQASAGVSYLGPVTAAVRVQWSGEQFEDDLNRLPLGSYATLDFRIGRRLTDRLELFLAVENLLDREYVVGRTPMDRLGHPRLIHGGIQLALFK